MLSASTHSHASSSRAADSMLSPLSPMDDGSTSLTPQDQETETEPPETDQWLDDEYQAEDDLDPTIGITEEAISDPEFFWEDQWKKFEPHIRPYELERSAYRYHPRPVTVEVRGLLWKRLTQNNRLRLAVDGFMILGLIPVDVPSLSEEPEDRGSVLFQLVQHTGHLSTSARDSRAVSFHDPPEANPEEKVRDLEQEVKDLTRQLRLMKSRELNTSSVSNRSTSPRSSPLLPPTPYIVNRQTYVASINGGTPVCLQLNYLEPDLAPYSVSFAGSTGRQMLPCTIVNHRFVLFIAPAHTAGSVAVSVLCTVGQGTLRKYCKATWLEYKDVGQTLSHHAVNQLVSDVPLPCSVSAPDPSEVGINTEGAKSEGDGLEDVETATAASLDTNPLVTPIDDHPPLTREMLDMLSQPRVAFAVTGPPTGDRRGDRTKSVSMMSADGTETLASSLAITHVTHGGSVIHDAVSTSVSEEDKDGAHDDGDEGTSHSRGHSRSPECLLGTTAWKERQI